MSGQRKALIVANDEYEQEGLPNLLARAADVEALGRVLGDPQLGDFSVEMLHNEPAYIIAARIEDLLSESHPKDVLLLYFSSYALKTDSGELFFAARNTRPNRLSSTAISAEFVRLCIQHTQSRSLVLLMDCGFGQDVTIPDASNVSVPEDYPRTEPSDGRGRAVITAAPGVMDHSQPSVFTAAMVEGLTSGDADRDEDGWVSLGELYDYILDKVREQNPHYNVARQLQGVLQMQELHVARSPRRPISSNPPLPGQIFISYRREDSAYPAGWLFDRLAEHFGQRRDL